VRLGDWETGRLGDWETGRLGDWETGRLGDWETGRLGDWEIGRMGEWGIGRVGTTRAGQWRCTAEKKNGRKKKKGKRSVLVPRVTAQHHVAGANANGLIDAARA